MEREKLDQKIITELFSVNNEIVITALNKIKEKGNKLYIPLLFDLLLLKPDKDVEKETLNLLGSIKVKETVPVFIHALDTPKYKPIRKTILSLCWQNGLDYHDYLPLFIDIIINEDWETAFEAFTVVDNMEVLPEQNIIDETKKKIADALKTASDKKEYFLLEILTKIG